MFPLRDDNPTELFPYVTLAVITICAAVWVVLQDSGFVPAALDASVCTFGAIPAEITGAGGARGPCPLGGLTWPTLVTSVFLHGSWMHLIGNMWFLWIFGNNVEDSMGHLRFLVFWLVTGVVATLAHVLLAPGSAIPLVGASGAISGVMGAYVVLYPRARISTLFFFLIFFRVIPVPAWLMLGYWFFVQVLSSATLPADGAGVAYAAHVGGFLAGVLLIPFFRNPRFVRRARRTRGALDRAGGSRRGWW